MPSTVLRHYRYDSLDRLINVGLANAPARQRFYCKNRLATEIEGALHYSIVQYDDQLLAQQQTEGGVSDTTLLITDQQRSVLNALKQTQQPIAYSPYGHNAESGLLSLLAFNGERPDSVTGHFLLGNGYRAFNPVLMRFNGPDSFSPFGEGGLNAYAYCQGDPINLRDPTGHSVIQLLAKIKALIKERGLIMTAIKQQPLKNFKEVHFSYTNPKTLEAIARKKSKLFPAEEVAKLPEKLWNQKQNGKIRLSKNSKNTLKQNPGILESAATRDLSGNIIDFEASKLPADVAVAISQHNIAPLRKVIFTIDKKIEKISSYLPDNARAVRRNSL